MAKYFSLKSIDVTREEPYKIIEKRSDLAFNNKMLSVSDLLLESLSIKTGEFVEDANKIFKKYKIKIPKNYPQDENRSAIFPRVSYMNIWPEFVLCVRNCIIIEKKFNMKTDKIIKNELIIPNSESGILHACAFSIILLYYLKEGKKVEILKEVKNQTNPDLLIDGISCDVKTKKDGDLFINIETGEPRERIIIEDILYDIGSFISKKNGAYKGIKQADVIFVDFSRRWAWQYIDFANLANKGFPELKKNRMIFFARYTLNPSDIYSYFIDFQSEFCKIIRTYKKTTTYISNPDFKQNEPYKSYTTNNMINSETYKLRDLFYEFLLNISDTKYSRKKVMKILDNMRKKLTTLIEVCKNLG